MPKPSSPVQTKDIFLLFLRLSKPYAFQRNTAIIISILTILGGIAGPLIIAQLLTIIQQGNIQKYDELWMLAFYYTLSQVWAETIGWRIVMYYVWKFETSMQRDIYTQSFQKLTEQTLFFHANRFSGSLVSQVSKLSSAVERFWDTILWSVIPLTLSLVGSIIILSTLLWQYAAVLGVLSVIFMMMVYVFSRPMAALSEKEAAASNKMSGELADTVSNVLAVKAAGNEAVEQAHFSKTVHSWRESSLAIMRGFLRVSTGYSSITTTIKVAAVMFAIYAAQNNTISVAAIYLIVTYTASVTRELWSMNSIMRNFTRVIGDAREMTSILADPIHLTDTTNEQLAVKDGEITFDTITYTHDEGTGDTLFKDLSLTIKPGEKVGLVGLSGSGKTTLTKLLLRFADIDSGTINIDGQDISHVTQTSLRQSIAYVPQEPLLFHRSIKENIAYGNPNATEKAIIAAAKKAGAYDFITKLEQGFDTTVGERGVKLSGGQRQRIAIARAILKDAPILVLDEATSALDSESETLIQKSLETLMHGRTSIVVAHRLSTIAKLDRIIVMQDGKIIEDGTHAKLQAKKHGVYARLWRYQSGGFIDQS